MLEIAHLFAFLIQVMGYCKALKRCCQASLLLVFIGMLWHALPSFFKRMCHDY